MKAQVPPPRWPSAITCRARVVLPELSGPYISMIRPRGKPPMPSAMSRPSEPVGITSVSAAASREPSFIIEPLPNARSIWPSAASRARCLSIASLSNRRNAVCIIEPPYSTAGKAVQRTLSTTYTICSRDASRPTLSISALLAGQLPVLVGVSCHRSDLADPGQMDDASIINSKGRQLGVTFLLYGTSADHVFHFRGKLLQAEWFGQEIYIPIAVKPPAEGILSVSGNEDHFYVRTDLSHLAYKPRSI